MSAPALLLDNVIKTYRAGIVGCSACVAALRGVTLCAREGEMIGVVGPNGAGKSTLLLCAAGLMRPDSGTVQWFGSRGGLGTRPPGIAYVPERPAWYRFLTARESLEYFATLHDIPIPERRRHIAQLLERLGLGAHADRRVGQLSRGMLQRLGLGQAMLCDPRLLLLDETLSGMDPVSRRDIRELLRELHGRGATVLLSSHDLAAVEALADRIIVLAAGQTVATLDPRTLTRRHAVELRVVSFGAALRALRAWVPETLDRRDRIRVPLAHATVDDVLAFCRTNEILVTDVRVIVDDLEQRFFDVLDRPASVAERPG